MRLLLLGDAGHVNLISWARILTRHSDIELHVASFNTACEAVPRVALHGLPSPPGRVLRKARYLLGIGALRRLLADLAPDLLVAYRTTSYGLMAARSGFHPFVAIAQGSDIFPSRGCRWVALLNRFVIARADLLQVWESHMAERLRSFGGPLREILCMAKGIDLDRFPARTGDDAQRNTLVCTRQLRRSYRHEVILRALAEVRDRGQPFDMLFLGEGEACQELEDFARALRLGASVRFAGRVPHEVLSETLRARDVYVSMQPSDGVSSSLLEAMASGLFPIVPDNAANRAWVRDGVTGFLVAAEDHRMLADRIVAALTDDTGLRGQAALLNRQIVEERASARRNTGQIIARYRALGAG